MNFGTRVVKIFLREILMEPSWHGQILATIFVFEIDFTWDLYTAIWRAHISQDDLKKVILEHSRIFKMTFAFCNKRVKYFSKSTGGSIYRFTVLFKMVYLKKSTILRNLSNIAVYWRLF